MKKYYYLIETNCKLDLFDANEQSHEQPQLFENDENGYKIDDYNSCIEGCIELPEEDLLCLEQTNDPMEPTTNKIWEFINRKGKYANKNN